MANLIIRNWLRHFSRFSAANKHWRRDSQKRRGCWLEILEDRTIPSVTIAATNNNGNGYSALDFNQSGGYVPPDTVGAAGPTNYVETVNQTIAIYSPKATGASTTSSSFSPFWFTIGKLPHADSSSSLSDPVVVY